VAGEWCCKAPPVAGVRPLPVFDSRGPLAVLSSA